MYAIRSYYELASAHWLASATILAGILGLALLAWFYWRDPERQPGDEAGRAWRKLEARLGRIGLAPAIGEGPAHYVTRVSLARVITSYSIHYTKLYELRLKQQPWRNPKKVPDGNTT